MIKSIKGKMVLFQGMMLVVVLDVLLKMCIRDRSYSDLMAVANSEVEDGEQPVVQSRYSIVMATSKRARQLIAGDTPLIDNAEGKKPLSIAVDELYNSKIRILGEDEEEE